MNLKTFSRTKNMYKSLVLVHDISFCAFNIKGMDILQVGYTARSILLKPQSYSLVLYMQFDTEKSTLFCSDRHDVRQTKVLLRKTLVRLVQCYSGEKFTPEHQNIHPTHYTNKSRQKIKLSCKTHNFMIIIHGCYIM